MTPAPLSDFAREVRAGLTSEPQKQLPCRWFYDDVGSALFEAITALPEYGLTRADARIIRANASAIVDSLPGRPVVTELGSGSGSKTRWILEALTGRRLPVYYPIDISRSALMQCERELSQCALVSPLELPYLEGLRAVVEARPGAQPLLVLFLGSTIGNFEPEAAASFLTGIRALMASGDALLLGTDLVKSTERMLAAYDDPAGVTAAFNRNLLARINRELGADFDLRAFRHEARYRARERRIEMHLRAQAAQTVHIADAALTVEVGAGESIWTESCYKFRLQDVALLARQTGFHTAAQWTDEEWPFAESLLVAC